MTLDDIPVLLIPPDFATPPRIAGRRGVSFHARGEARRLGIFPTGGLQHVLNHKFVFDTRLDARLLEDFFNERCGSWGDFFALGWHAELEPLQSLETGDGELAITPVNYGAVYLDIAKKTLTGHYIYLHNRVGHLHITKVVAVAGSNPEVLQLRDPVPEGMTFLVGDYHVGFLYHVRFMGDQLALEFSGPDACSCELAMLELVENSATVEDELHDAELEGPDGGTNAEAGNDGNRYWLRCESPILGPNNPTNPDPQSPGYDCPASATAEITLPDDIGGLRPVEIWIRGVSELRGYTGGVASSPFYTGGVSSGGGANVFKLTVGEDVYYINHGTTFGCVLLDYKRTVMMKAGDVIRFEYDSVDSRQFHNAGFYNVGIWSKSSETLLVAAIPPGSAGFNGQFAQVDFTL